VTPHPLHAKPWQWRALHSYFVDAVLSQEAPDPRDHIIALCGGITADAFRESIARGRLRVRSLLDDGGELVYRVEILADDGWCGLVRPPAGALGFDPADVLPHEQALWRELFEAEGIPDPDQDPPSDDDSEA
jgi:hypothetical protein